METASGAFGRRDDGHRPPLRQKMQTQGVIMEQDVVSKIESGDRLVTDYEVRAFAAVFGVAFENLIEDEE